MPYTTSQNKHEDEIPFLNTQLPRGYRIIRYLGSGAYGQVYQVLDQHSGKKYALKYLAGLFATAAIHEAILREIKILRMLSGHPTIIALKHIVMPSDPKRFNSLILIFDHMPATLFRLFKMRQPLDNQQIQYLLYQLLCGVNYLHSAGLVHRDLKPENILIDEYLHLKICDFGMARALEIPLDLVNEVAKVNYKDGFKTVENQEPYPRPPHFFRRMSAHVSSRWYRSPEIILGSQRYGQAIDLWAVGCILAEMLMLQRKNKEDILYQPLFPGGYCDPLSPKDYGTHQGSHHQLTEIFSCLGTPSAEELQAFDYKEAREYARRYPQKQAKNWGDLFPEADPLVLDLLKKCLTYDPAKRISAAEALAHPYLKSMQDMKWQLSFSLPAKEVIEGSAELLRLRESIVEYYRYEVELERQLKLKDDFVPAADQELDRRSQRKLRERAAREVELSRFSFDPFNKKLTRVLTLREARHYNRVEPSLEPLKNGLPHRFAAESFRFFHSAPLEPAKVTRQKSYEPRLGN